MSIAGYKNGFPIAVSEEHHDYVEINTVNGKTDFIVDYDFSVDQKIEVEIDGREQPLEGVNWTRDATLNKIILSEGIHVGSVFKARIHIL